MTLWHLTTPAAWRAARAAGALAPPSLATEGFVHLSTAAQWRRTAARFFRGQAALVLLEIDPARLDAEVRYEAADGEAFPHLYGALPVAAVRTATGLAVDADGTATVGAPVDADA